MGGPTGPHHRHQPSTPGPHAGPRSSVPDLALRAQRTFPAGPAVVGALGSALRNPHAYDCAMHEEANPSCFGTCASGHGSGALPSPHRSAEPHSPSRSKKQQHRNGVISTKHYIRSPSNGSKDTRSTPMPLPPTTAGNSVPSPLTYSHT